MRVSEESSVRDPAGKHTPLRERTVKKLKTLAQEEMQQPYESEHIIIYRTTPIDRTQQTQTILKKVIPSFKTEFEKGYYAGSITFLTISIAFFTIVYLLEKLINRNVFICKIKVSKEDLRHLKKLSFDRRKTTKKKLEDFCKEKTNEFLEHQNQVEEMFNRYR